MWPLPLFEFLSPKEVKAQGCSIDISTNWARLVFFFVFFCLFVNLHFFRYLIVVLCLCFSTKEPETLSLTPRLVLPVLVAILSSGRVIEDVLYTICSSSCILPVVCCIVLANENRFHRLHLPLFQFRVAFVSGIGRLEYHPSLPSSKLSNNWFACVQDSMFEPRLRDYPFSWLI